MTAAATTLRFILRQIVSCMANGAYNLPVQFIVQPVVRQIISYENYLKDIRSTKCGISGKYHKPNSVF